MTNNVLTRHQRATQKMLATLHLSSLSKSWLAQWLERLTGHQKVAGLIPVWAQKSFF